MRASWYTARMERICVDCGTAIEGGPRLLRCGACKAELNRQKARAHFAANPEAARAASRESHAKKQGFTRLKCRECGASIPPKQRFCDACRRKHKLESNRERYRSDPDGHNAKARERYHNDPNFRSKVCAQAKIWRDSNPKKRAAGRARERKRIRDRMATDPAYREKMLERTRQRRAKVKASYSSLRNLLYLLEKQHGRCAICGKWLPEDRTQVEVDHIVPIAKDGSNDVSNLQLTHRTCNRTKGTGV